MSGKIDILGVKFDDMTIAEISSILLDKIRGERAEKPFVVFTPNPEIVMETLSDSRLSNALGAGDLISADGVGIVWASKYFSESGKKIKERASGYDIVQELFALGSKSGGFSAFFLGGSAEVVAKAAELMGNKYENLSIFARDGYFSASENKAIVAEIASNAPDLLLVGLGSPKQEYWILENAASLPVKVIITVGGSFDVMSGSLKRAPVAFQRLGLEWLYRLIRQPRRLKRMLRLPLFVIEVLKYNGRKSKRKST